MSLPDRHESASLGALRPDRRSFVALFGLFAVAGGGAMAALRASGYSVPRDVAKSLRVLAPWQFAVINAIGRRVLDPVSADVGLFADRYLEGLAASDRDDLLGLLGYVEHLAPFLHGSAQRFTHLLPADQDRVLAGLEQSDVGLLRGGFQALKALAAMAYYRQESAFAPLGYGGPVVRWSGT